MPDVQRPQKKPMKLIVIAQTPSGEELGRSEIELLPDQKVIVSPLDFNAAIQMMNEAAKKAIAHG